MNVLLNANILFPGINTYTYLAVQLYWCLKYSIHELVCSRFQRYSLIFQNLYALWLFSTLSPVQKFCWIIQRTHIVFSTILFSVFYKTDFYFTFPFHLWFDINPICILEYLGQGFMYCSIFDISTARKNQK